ncbi:ABC transporter ATP-binding protein [Kyrpidia tusciae]|uniref:ABC transporter related protein n=1 Tax=Kyrpidia tusciae (strain DSM 2912 / NBRC 15312 / T2) TaxID=562970 RepID=D5WU76_KYRT2|nr:ABC transporter ATP-binding protein [Kyrpidia tusciae]ADG07328.1 ABC transporter related protein [Kyrpidia tusciae DSM 2912]
MEDAVILDGVCKTFRGFRLENVSFSIKKGYITGFIGPNGSGKTTTIKLIMNLLHPDAGTIRRFGQNDLRNNRTVMNRIGFVYAEPPFYDDLTVEQVKTVVAAFYSKWDETAYRRYRDAFEVPGDRKIKALSTGMKMKFSIALALSHHADLILMDEPTSGLDPVIRREILELLSEVIQDEEKAIFFSTHITTDLERIADYLIFIHRGRIVYSGEKDRLLEAYRVVKGPREILTPGVKRILIGLRETGVGFEGLAPTDSVPALGKQVLAEPPSLDDIMLYTVKGEPHA